MATFRSESFDHYFVSGGCVWTLTSGLTGAMSSGVLYYAGVRIAISAVGSKLFTASQDTYVDISNANVVYYTAVANGASAPAVAANRTRNAVIVTDGTTITTIIQYDRDQGGNLVYNTKPVAKTSNTPRIKIVTTVTTLTPDVTSTDICAVTALASGLTIALPVGSPANGQGLMLRFKDNGTGRALTWNGTYRPIGVTIPAATVASKTTYVAMRYNSQDSKWDCLSVGREN